MNINYISDIEKLEVLSKEISDLIFNNKYQKVEQLDLKRKGLIENIVIENNNQSRIKLLEIIKSNQTLIIQTEKNITNLKLERSKFDNRFKAYSSSN